MIKRKAKIFIVDNEIEICNLLKDYFDFIGYESEYETDGKKALAELENIDYDVMFVDLRLNVISGIEILEKSKKIKPLSEVIIITGYGSEETILQTLRKGAFSYIQKPVSFSEIKVQTEEALAKHQFNLKTEEIMRKINTVDSNLGKHFEVIVNFDRLCKFLNLSIDIHILSDSILEGIATIIPGHFYSFLFFDNLNKEMLIYSRKSIHPDTIEEIQKEVKNHFEEQVNIQIEDECEVHLSVPENGNKKPAKPVKRLTNIFVPILIENSIHGILGISGDQIKNEDYIKYILRIVSTKISGVLTNAAVHRNTKLLALTDGLTGLFNRSAFHERLETEYQRFVRYGSYLSMIVADFDDLKQVNDSYGHPVGDVVIKKIGDILREASRETDVVSRYGGDEFVIVLPQTNIENAINMAERIRQKIEEYSFNVNERHFNCTLSLGVATAHGSNINSSEDLLESADRALYESKRSGRNKVSVFRP